MKYLEKFKEDSKQFKRNITLVKWNLQKFRQKWEKFKEIL